MYLADIFERIERIESYTQGGREVFLQSPLIQDAVIRNFEVMGEGVKRISQELTAKSPSGSLAEDCRVAGCINSRLIWAWI